MRVCLILSGFAAMPTGSIPTEMGKLSKLTILKLGFNRLEGEVNVQSTELKNTAWPYTDKVQTRTQTSLLFEAFEGV